MMAYGGGCLCGQIRYEATGAPDFPHLCSCRMCQTWSGAPTVAWVGFPRGSLTWTGPGGAPRMYRSSETAERGFCPSCGGTLCAVEDGADAIVMTIASLDEPDRIVPGPQHSYRDAAPTWWSVSIARKE
jgi:hypothetical protein